MQPFAAHVVVCDGSHAIPSPQLSKDFMLMYFPALGMTPDISPD